MPMTYWLNHVTVDATAGASHTVDPSNPTGSGTVVDGVAFTPTAGRLLVCVVAGPVTSATPSGWTLPTNGSAVSTDGLYVFHKTAAGSDTLATTHNSGSYRVTFDFYEFASTASFVKSTSFPGSASGASNSITGLTGSNLIMAPIASTGASGAFSFTGATEHFEYVPSDSQHRYAIANEFSASASVAVAATSATHEQLNFAIGGLSTDVTISVPVATATADALVPVVSTTATIDVPVATASADALVPVVSTANDATVLVPTATATATALVPVLAFDAGTDVSNVFAGRERGGFATVEVTVPVVEPIGVATARVDKAVPLPLPVLVKGRPT